MFPFDKMFNGEMAHYACKSGVALCSVSYSECWVPWRMTLVDDRCRERGIMRLAITCR